MADHYLKLRALHIACVYASVLLLLVRHVMNLRGMNWRKYAALRIVPHAVDTVLILAGVALSIAIQQYPFTQGWLTVKLIALVAYVALAAVALRKGQSQGVSRAAFFAAVVVFAFMISVARTHSALGVFGQWF